MPKPKPMKPKDETITLRGRVTAFNVSPKGDVEGLLVDVDGQIAQVNLEKGHEPPKTWTEGRKVTLTVHPEEQRGPHRVYKLADEGGRAAGKVVRFNHARHGEVNGFLLDDGTFVHLKPHGAKRADVKLGDQVTVEGPVRLGSVARVIEPTSIEKARRASSTRVRHASV